MKTKSIILALVLTLGVLFALTACTGQKPAEEATAATGAETSEDARLEEYAELLIQKGLNVQEGQKVVIKSSVESYAFTRLCMEEAYAAGASDVVIVWEDKMEQKQRYLYGEDTVMDTYPEHMAVILNGIPAEKAAYLWLRSEVPGLYADVDSARIARFDAAKAKALAPFKNNDTFSWCVAGVPNGTWAMKVFPELTEEEAMDALWNAILGTVYVNGDQTSSQKWDDHVKELEELADRMNALQFRSLHYTNSLGTDFTVELPEDQIWNGGNGITPDGLAYSPNMPTEEIYSAPLKESGNGVLYASKPLVLNGVVVNDLKFTVKDGKIVEAEASSGLDTLKEQLKLDEGASYFGEIALVSFDSSISKQNLVYYDTLYDENASCHFAFGDAYSSCIQGGTSMSEEELAAKGINQSSTHIDFMIGTEDLKITGTTYDGREIVVFENGNFALD